MKIGFISLVAVRASAKRKKFICASLCLMLCFISVSAQIRLSFNPEPGTKYEFQTEAVQSFKQNVMGQDMVMETEMKGAYLMEIKSKTPQEIHVQFTYQGFVFSTSNSMMPMMNIRYNSKNPIENPSDMDRMLERMFSTLIGKPFTVVFAPDGSAKSVIGMGAIIEDMQKAISADGQIAAQIGAQMTQQFSDEAMKNMFGQWINIYPANAVNLGDSWDMEITMPMNNMNFGVKTTNTLQAVNMNRATIGVAGNIDANLGEGKLTGSQTGTMIVDIPTGITLSSEISQNMKGVISTQGMDIQMEMISNTKMTTKRVD